jgi:hypothetical protein
VLVDADVVLSAATGTSGVVLPAAFTVNASAFSAHVTFQTALDFEGGFLFAKAVYTASLIYYALELSGDSHVLFHYVSGGMQQTVNFSVPFVLNDAQWHTLALSVTGSVAVLSMDGAPFMLRLLRGPVSDCGNAPAVCVLRVGQLSTFSGRRFVGFVREVRFYLRRAVTLVAAPVGRSDQTGPVSFSLLPYSPGVTQTFAGQRTDTVSNFGGLSARGVAGAVSLAATVLHAHGTTGYIAAKTNGDGSVRHFAVYSDPAGVHLYHKVAGSTALHRASWAVRIDDGLFHRVLVTVIDVRAALFIDGVRVGRRTLVGVLDDCTVPSGSCRLLVGGRATAVFNSAAYPWPGSMAGMTLYAGAALPFDPAPAPPLAPMSGLVADANVSNALYFDLLDTSRHAYTGNVSHVNGFIVLDGQSDTIKVTAHDFSIGSNFTLVFSLRIKPGDSGFIYAKTDVTGAKHYLSLAYDAVQHALGAPAFAMCCVC